MSNCPACAQAAQSTFSGMYHFTCLECCMRGYARSSIAAEAAKASDDSRLRAAIAKSHPQADIEHALGLVRKWWRFDHPAAEQRTA